MNIGDKLEQMRQLCKTRPLKYSDLDHLNKGSTEFLHQAGYSIEEIADALDLSVRDVANNLKGTGFTLDYKKISKFEDNLPDNMGDTITIKVPSWGNEDEELYFKAMVIQCIPRGGGCGLSIVLLEDTKFEIPLFGAKKKGDEIVVPLDWYVR
ncbi:hypothetical protein RE476_07070 [Methanolobus mangrovi]|uniref:Uncharacterized protein n=1 Tax=Methanolobus mangrovi TaxID=3072977 RepID=A0AA51UDW6_9EURY|nr:hypothetical protein [Methanolobus mangrovi]WMW21174.1 hypothetical protein RE476_07070 [Methanolobus mangrovi]